MHLLMQADSAMYRAKQEGRDGVRFYLPAMGEAARRDLALQNRLHEALERGELELFWQPQTGRERRVIGFEGLLRWKHPEEVVLEARKFIPLAESTGLIRPIGDWVLEQACRFLARLGAQYPQAGPLHVSINIAPRELRQEAFARRLAARLEAHDANPALLTLELREECLLGDLDEAGARLRRLKEIGVRIAVDAFGVGVCSLVRLKRLPVDLLKIDSSLVAELARDQETLSIVDAILVMAAKLHLEVVAGGVESEGQFKCLDSRRCDGFQGHLLAPPLSESECLERLRAELGGDRPGAGRQGAFER